jgi:hypothetical protein
MANANWPAAGGGGGGGVVTNAANVGTGVGLFQVLSGTVLDFRTITDGTGLTWTLHANDVQGNVSLAPFSTTDLAEGTNLYFTQARARLSLSNSAPITYNSGTGAIGITQSGVATDGYLSSVDWNTFNNKQASLTFGNLTDVGTDGIIITGGTGAVIGAGTAISQHVADASHNGYLSQTDWATFNGKQSALTIGDFTDAGTDGITVTGGTGAVIGSGTSISQHVADATHNGYLSSSDWNTFSASGALVTQGAPGLVASAGQLLGTNDGSVAAIAGNVGEIIESIIASGSAISVPNNTPTNITSVSIGQGDWLATAVITLHGTLTGDGWLMSASDNNSTLGPIGDSTIQTPTLPTAAYDASQVITKEYTVPFGGSANIYAVVQANYSVGSATGYGRLTLRRIR